MSQDGFKVGCFVLGCPEHMIPETQLAFQDGEDDNDDDDDNDDKEPS